MKSKAIITINGRRYDASGNSLKPLEPIGSVDGVQKPVIASRHADRPESGAPKPPHERHISHHSRQPEHSHTLARRAVRKPSGIPTTKSHPAIIGHDRDSEIARRAAHVKPSPMLQRFSYPVMPVVPEPKSTSAATESVTTSAKDLFVDRQLMLATAHNQHVAKHHKARKSKVRRSAIAVAACAIFAVVGLYTYNRYTSALSLRMAGAHAGFSVDVPHYTPAGFGLSKQIAADSGRVILSYQSHSDDRHFLLEQTASTLDNEALRQKIETSDNQYQTIKINGLTIYISGQNTATWIDHGKVFTIRGNPDLSNNQITAVAESL